MLQYLKNFKRLLLMFFILNFKHSKAHMRLSIIFRFQYIYIYCKICRHVDTVFPVKNRSHTVLFGRKLLILDVKKNF